MKEGGLVNFLLVAKSVIVKLSEHLILFYYDPGPVFTQKSLRQMPAISKLTNDLGKANANISYNV